jgi:UrcA family protein
MNCQLHFTGSDRPFVGAGHRSSGQRESLSILARRQCRTALILLLRHGSTQSRRIVAQPGGTNMKIATLALSAALAAAVAAGPASAERTQAVPYGDLNLATPAGQAALQSRLNKAAWKVCRFDDNGRVVAAEKENACYRSARQKVNVRFAELVAERQRGG